ncbi:YcbK family protein [Polaromonas naphthalenivorans]|nr:DUF882 domain-containing protein [Polaromonas naphthalenivorans]
MGQTQDFWSMPRTLHLYRPATRETVHATYFANGEVILCEYEKLCILLRDVQAGQAVQMSLVTLDILAGIQGWLRANGINSPLHTNSGYRSPLTNNHTEGAAKNSRHMYGMAWDGRVPQVSTESLARFAVYLKGGGVGFYQEKNFLHIDSGSLRTWRG